MPDWGVLFGDIRAATVAFWIVAAIAVVVGVYKAWPVIRRFVETIDALQSLPELTERIRDQVENDHSTNLREEVTQILDETVAMSSQIRDLTEWQKNHEEKTAATLARIARLEGEK